jgi:hypothetical protein
MICKGVVRIPRHGTAAAIQPSNPVVFDSEVTTDDRDRLQGRVISGESDPGDAFDDFLMPTTPKRYEGRLVLLKRLSTHCDDLFEHLRQNGVLGGQSQWNSELFARAPGIGEFQRLLVPTLQDLLHNVLVPPAGNEPIPFVPAMWRFTIDPSRGPIFRKCLKRSSR